MNISHDDYNKAMKIQELREQRVDLMWMYITAEIAALEWAKCTEIQWKVKELDNQIKELQNG